MKLKEIRSITIITGVMGFCLGAILPTYTLLIKNDGVLGSIPDWLGAFGTTGALFLSIYVAKTSFADAKKEKQERMKKELKYLKALQGSIQEIIDMVENIEKGNNEKGNNEKGKNEKDKNEKDKNEKEFSAAQELFWDMPMFDKLVSILEENGYFHDAGQMKTWIDEYKKRYTDDSKNLSPKVIGQLTSSFLKLDVIVENAENRLDT
ncbi:hypothetical protein [Levilactobacillus brevis]|uniref:hypothetical protein n=1 Tax=Levilactobacillus brevis TaxID=1580 RepID=UPI0035A2A260